MYFPSWRYHRTLPACIVQDPAEDAALGPGWAHNPAEFENEPEPEPQPEPETEPRKGRKRS